MRIAPSIHPICSKRATLLAGPTANCERRSVPGRQLGCWSLYLAAAIAGCAAPPTRTSEAPGVAFPMSLGEGNGDPDDPDRPELSRAPSSASTKAEPDPAAQHRKRYGSLPDPSPLSSAEQWELTLAYDHGTLALTRADRRSFAEPVVTARRMGRFAVELWIGHELIDRVRFDFPLVVDAPEASERRPLMAPVAMHQEASSTQTLLIPDSPRATRLLLVDRATGREAELPWPPDRPTGPDAAPPNLRTDSTPP